MNITYLPFKITEDFPSWIVADYDMFLSRVQSPSSYLTASKHCLDRNTLHALNQEVKTFNVETSSKADQIFYPLLNFFYHISLAANFFQIVRVKNKYRLQPTDLIAEYERLNTAEKYFAMFEAFWVYTDWAEILRDDAYVSEFNIPQDDQFVALLCTIPASKEIYVERVLEDAGYLNLLGTVHIIRILSFFGLLTHTLKSLSPREQYSKGYIKLKSIKINPFGSRFFELLRRERPFTLWNMPSRHFTGAEYPGQDFDDKHSGPAAFAGPFKQMLHDTTIIDKGLPIQNQGNLIGTFIFKINIDDASRTLSISGEDTLDDLHLAIQEVYRFRNDHLYSFSFDPQRLHPKKSYHSPEGGEYPFASEVSIGQLHLYVGQRLLYVFDYGDWWEFSIEVISITEEPHQGKFTLLQQQGEGPEQYPEFDDDWE